MKFSEIKHKIKNLGNFKSLKEIKKAGLRIVRNTKTGDYWLIEEEFLKPVIKSPRECKSILIKPEDLKYKVLMVHKSKKELKGKKVLDYIEWGEKQRYNKRPTCRSRKWWWDLVERNGYIIWSRAHDDKHRILFNKHKVQVADTFSEFISNIDNKVLCAIFNSYMICLEKELLGRSSFGQGALGSLEVDIVEFLGIDPSKLDKSMKQKFKEALGNIMYRPIHSIFTELDFDPSKPIREQEPNPLPDRKALDDIVFDALGLTEKERKEVYWAVAELVKNRLEKAKKQKVYNLFSLWLLLKV